MAEAKQPSPALDQYATWRPRLARSATWAGTAAFLSKTMGGEARHIIPATIAAGVAGAADATLEDKIRRNKNLQEVHMRGYGKTAEADKEALSGDLVRRAEAEAAKKMLTAQAGSRANPSLMDEFKRRGAQLENFRKYNTSAKGNWHARPGEEVAGRHAFPYGFTPSNAKTASMAEDPRVASPEVVERVEANTNGVLGELFAHKDAVGAKARSQLGELFPGASKEESYGRSLRLKPGGGALSAMLNSIHPVATK